MTRLALLLALPVAWLTAASMPHAENPGASPEALQSAIGRSLPLLQSSAETWFQHQSCSSCHHQGLGLLAVAVARERSIPIDESLVQRQLARTFRPSATWLEDAALGELSINEPIGQSYRILGVGAAGGTRTPVTDAVVHLLAGKQHVGGWWPSSSHRPPHEDSAFTATATTIRALSLFPIPSRKTDLDIRVDRAKRWLETARPASTEDRVMQLLGLAWAGASARALQSHATALLREQRKDGGWAQIPTRESDAYTTGQVLVALNQAARIAPADAAWRRGLAFLVASQRQDGSWHVPTRRTTSPGLAYFESGYPHGRDQFISYAGAAWATIALTLAGRDEVSPALVGSPPPRVPASPDPAGPDGLTPLMRAAFYGSFADLDRELATPQDVNAASSQGLTALMFAVRDPVKTARLLDAGADPARTTKAGHTALLLAAAYDGAYDSAERLARRGAALDAAPATGLQAGLAPVGRAAMRGDTRVADLLLRRGARIDGPARDGVSPLMAATWIGDASMVRWLIARGADASAAESDASITALMVAAEEGQTAVVRALLDGGARVNAVDANGYSALLLAAGSPDLGDTVIIDLLIAAGADLARRTPDGEAAPSIAERWRKPHVARRLLGR